MDQKKRRIIRFQGKNRGKKSPVNEWMYIEKSGLLLSVKGIDKGSIRLKILTKQ